MGPGFYKCHLYLSPYFPLSLSYLIFFFTCHYNSFIIFLFLFYLCLTLSPCFFFLLSLSLSNAFKCYRMSTQCWILTCTTKIRITNQSSSAGSSFPCSRYDLSTRFLCKPMTRLWANCPCLLVKFKYTEM